MRLTLPPGTTRVIAVNAAAVERNAERKQSLAPVFDVYEPATSGEYVKVASGIHFNVDGPCSEHYLPRNTSRRVPTYGLLTDAAIEIDDGQPQSEPAASPQPKPVPTKPTKKAVKSAEGV